MFQPDLLKDKRILVTGGGTGLGKSMGRRFVELGAELVICGRRQAMLDETAADFARDLGAKVVTLPCDIRVPGAVEDMMDAIWQVGPLDVLVNNAGANFIARTETLSYRAVDAVIGVNLQGAAYCTLAAGRRWIEAGHKGTVLSILSISSQYGRAFAVPSAMGKAGLLAMTKSLAVEWGPKGIRTLAIAPGLFPTPGAWERLHPPERQRAVGDPGAKVPLGRVGEHGELANLAAYLVSDQAGYINGEMITIDGGAALRNAGGVHELLAWSDTEWDAIRVRR
ncbi:MAG: SDR family oxidoreductase [Alphaproteobacteria bacterium]|nr:SDR family oxidoreductase [Alphaproteobacteria bacterium]